MSGVAMGFAAINLAYVALLLGAFNRSLQRVRVLLVVAALFFIAYGTIQGIGSMVLWNFVIGGLNLYRLLAGIRGEGRVALSAGQDTIRRQFFSTASPDDFLRFWERGHDMTCVDGPLPISEDPAQEVLLIVRGGVARLSNGMPIQVLGPGAIIERTASSTALRPADEWLACGAVRLRAWQIDGPEDPDPIRRMLAADRSAAPLAIGRG